MEIGKNDTIRRLARPETHFPCPVAPLRDARLGLDGMGLLVHIMSRNDDWGGDLQAIAKETGTNIGRVNMAMSKIVAAGYVVRVPIRVGDKIVRNGMVVCSSPPTAEQRQAIIDREMANVA